VQAERKIIRIAPKSNILIVPGSVYARDSAGVVKLISDDDRVSNNRSSANAAVPPTKPVEPRKEQYDE
jgi:hypothetical protein